MLTATPHLAVRHCRNGRLAPRAAFTLLEIILALTIAGLVLAAIGMAIDFHLRALDRSRRSVEQAQLARAVLRRIADDLRGVVRHEEIDYESLVPKTPSIAGLSSGALPTSGQTAPSTGASSGGAASAGNSAVSAAAGSTGASPESTTEDEMSSSSGLAPSIPGLYGKQVELEVDVSRLPRPDEYAAAASAGGVVADRLSDVKTVTYYVRAATADLPGGLVRRALDRAATSYAVDNAEIAGLDEAAEVLAPEVQSIEFSYFNGVADSEWLTEWDSATEEGLPMAVRITITLAPLAGTTSTPIAAAEGEAPAVAAGPSYSIVVSLPAAVPAEDSASSTTPEDEPASESSSSGSSSSNPSSSSAGGSQP